MFARLARGRGDPPGRDDVKTTDYMNRPEPPTLPLTEKHDTASEAFDAGPDQGPDAEADVLAELLSEGERRESVVSAEHHGLRLDKWLVTVAPEFSRSHLQSLIEAGKVRAGALALDSASRKVKAGQSIEVWLTPTAQSHAFRPEPVPLDIIFEDAHLLVVNKPAGLVVHPAAGHWSGTLLNGLLAHHPGAAVLPRAGIVHRLDKDTSGLLVVAKTLEAQTALTRDIAARTVRREYLALAHGLTDWDERTLEAPVGRDPVSRIRMAVTTSGKPARTDVRSLHLQPEVRLGKYPGVSVVACRLHTGRTHQIRVHMAWVGHPLLADGVYGGVPGLGLERQALHAAALGLNHPVSGQWCAWTAPLPQDMVEALRAMKVKPADVLAQIGYNGA